MISYIALMSGQDREANDKQNKTIAAWCGWLVQSMKKQEKKIRRIQR